MKRSHIVPLIALLGASGLHAQEEPAKGFAAIGLAHAAFHARSGELQGAPGTTPPGVTASVDSVNTAVVELKYTFAANWSADLGFGYPPRVDLIAGGTAAGLGKVAEAKAWFPHVTVSYHLPTETAVTPYLGAGVHRTWFSGVRTTPAYDGAVLGTATDAKVKSDVGPVLRLGAEVALPGGWVADVLYLKYWIKSQAVLTTQTPGAGGIERRLDLRAKPDIFAVLIGRRF